MEVSGQHTAPATTYGKEPWSQLGRRLGGPLSQSVHFGDKSLAPTGFINQTIQPIALTLYFISITNKMQCYTIFFITVNAAHVSGGFSTHHQELKTVHTASGICQVCLLLVLAVAASKLDIYPMLCVQF